MQLPHGPAEIIQFTLVLDLLALGEFQRLQQLIQILHHLLQRFDDAVNVFHSLCDRRTLALWFRGGRGRRGTLRPRFALRPIVLRTLNRRPDWRSLRAFFCGRRSFNLYDGGSLGIMLLRLDWLGHFGFGLCVEIRSFNRFYHLVVRWWSST